MSDLVRKPEDQRFSCNAAQIGVHAHSLFVLLSHDKSDMISPLSFYQAERRIIYVGCIPDHYTRRKLHHRFEKFGEIEQVQLHFREHG